jgi:hypothetical protein
MKPEEKSVKPLSQQCASSLIKLCPSGIIVQFQRRVEKWASYLKLIP